MMRQKIVVTGLGMVCPAGMGILEPWKFILEGRSACGLVTHFDTGRYRSKVAAEIKNWDPSLFMDADFAKRIDKVAQFSLAASRIALDDSELLKSDLDFSRVGVCIGTGLGGTFFTETQLTALVDYGPKRVHPLTVPNVNPNAVATFVAMQWHFLGPNLTVSTACASGSHAIGQAMMMLQAGRADVMLAGGSENPIMPMMFAGFDAMRVMSQCNDFPGMASRPFDVNRDGFVMGEGAAVLILETEDHATKRGAKIYAELAGYGANNGGFHMVTPQPDGCDAAQAMRLAIEDAHLIPSQIDYINAHGTSTKANDLAETHAIKSVFGEYAYRLPVSSTKGATGHMIGAAGAVEACFSVLAIHTQTVPPTANYTALDPDCDLDYVPVARPSILAAVLSNSFGFGNNNACLVFKKQG